ncbi:VOC family protein [Isoptericola sp. 4D.3]|jgi:catechol 2,3-dioxygenase-like lactoylglutathione lyase family enzyme|uniref:VOC family protein n=1 Tax=Isoptericola peretonis TaxID=2918523 RepID=A0ABT0J0S4_9MICO|nr:VOC family protein [Isoptericola sp. 4D.3]
MITSLYPVLAASDVPTAARFYADLLGMAPTFTSDWYVSLRSGTAELAVVDAGHATIPEVARGTRAAGVLVTVEVDDVDAVHARVVAEGTHELLLPLRDEEFGQRHFIVAGPDGALVDVVTPIPPSGEFAALYAGSRPATD